MRFPGLNISIPPKGEFDLDSVLPREISENSNQLQVAFEEGYLQNIWKDPSPATTSEELQKTLEGFKEKILQEIQALLPKGGEEKSSLLEEITQLKESFQGDVEKMHSTLEEIQKRLSEEKKRVLEDERLSQAELRARLKFLEEQEKQIIRNFERLGKTTKGEDKSSSLEEQADLLSDL